MSTHSGMQDMDAMIAALADDHGLARRDAREALIKIGQPAVAPLVRALQDPNWKIRWGAAKALGQIGDPTAASALVKTLIVHGIAEQDPNLSRVLTPMSRVLEDIDPTIQVPPAAQLALEALNKPKSKTLPS